MSPNRRPICDRPKQFSGAVARQQRVVAACSPLAALRAAAAPDGARLESLELAVKRRAADSQPSRHLRQLAVLLADGKANELGLDLHERPDVPGGVKEPPRADRTELRSAIAACRGELPVSDTAAASATCSRPAAWAVSSPVCAKMCEKFDAPEPVAFGQSHGAINRVLHLPDVAGPVEANEQAQLSGGCAFVLRRQSA